MKIECSKYEWELLEDLLMQKFGETEVCFEDENFFCKVLSYSDKVIFQIYGTFKDGGLNTHKCPEYECCMCPIKKERNGNKMKIECTKSQWNIIEACFYDTFGAVETSYNNPNFFSKVYSASGALALEITGTFTDGGK